MIQNSVTLYLSAIADSSTSWCRSPLLIREDIGQLASTVSGRLDIHRPDRVQDTWIENGVAVENEILWRRVIGKRFT